MGANECVSLLLFFFRFFSGAKKKKKKIVPNFLSLHSIERKIHPKKEKMPEIRFTQFQTIAQLFRASGGTAKPAVSFNYLSLFAQFKL